MASSPREPHAIAARLTDEGWRGVELAARNGVGISTTSSGEKVTAEECERLIGYAAWLATQLSEEQIEIIRRGSARKRVRMPKWAGKWVAWEFRATPVASAVVRIWRSIEA